MKVESHESRKLFVEKAKNHKEKLISSQGADWEGVKESVIKPLFSVQGLDYLILLEHDLKAYRDEDRGQPATTHYILSREQYLKIKKAIPEDKLLLSFDTAAALIQKIKILEELTDIFEYYLLIEEKVTFNIPILGRFYKNKAQKEFFTRLREFQSTLNLENQKQSIAHYMGCILNTVHRLQDGTIDDNVVEVLRDLLKAVEKSDRIVTTAVTPKKTPSSKGNIFERITEFALSIIGKIKEVLGTEELTLETKEYKPATYNKFQKFFKGKKHLFYNHGMDSETFRFLHKYIFKYAAESDVEQLKSLSWFQPGPQNLIEVIPVQKKEFLLVPLPLKNYTLSFKKDSKNYSRYKFIKSTFYNLTFINFTFQNLPKEISKIDTLEEFTIGRERFLYTLNQIEAIYNDILIIEAGLSTTQPPLDPSFKEAYLKVLTDAKRKLLVENLNLVTHLKDIIQADFRKNYPETLSKIYDEALLKQSNKFLEKIAIKSKEFENDTSLADSLKQFKLQQNKIKELLSYQCVPYSLNEDVELRIKKDFETLALNKYENNKSIHMLQWINDLLIGNYEDIEEFLLEYNEYLSALSQDTQKYWLMVETRVLKKVSIKIENEQDKHYKIVFSLDPNLATKKLKEIIKNEIDFNNPSSISILLHFYSQSGQLLSLNITLEIIYQEMVKQLQEGKENFALSKVVKESALSLVFKIFKDTDEIYKNYQFLQLALKECSPLQSKLIIILSDLVLGNVLKKPLTHADLLNLKTYSNLLGKELGEFKKHVDTVGKNAEDFVKKIINLIEAPFDSNTINDAIEDLLQTQEMLIKNTPDKNANKPDTNKKEDVENEFLAEINEYTVNLQNNALKPKDLFSLFVSYHLATLENEDAYKPFIDAFNTYFYFVLNHMKNILCVSFKGAPHHVINYHQNAVILAFIEKTHESSEGCFTNFKEKLKLHESTWLNYLKCLYSLSIVYGSPLNVDESYVLSCLRLSKDLDFSQKTDKEEQALAFLKKEGMHILTFILNCFKQNLNTLSQTAQTPKSTINLGFISIPINTDKKCLELIAQIDKVILSLTKLHPDDFEEGLKKVQSLSPYLKFLTNTSVMDSLGFLKVIEHLCEPKFSQMVKTF